MANTYTLLETITVGAAGASSVTFNSIPQTGYTDLVIKASTRGTVAEDSYSLRFNNDSGSNYPYRRLLGDGATASSNGGTTTAAPFGRQPESGYTANTFGNSEFYIPNYTSSNYKSISADSVNENNATTARAQLGAGLWNSTAAITSIQIFPGSGAFAQYSTFSLYGVSALGVTPTKAPKATGGSIIQTDGTYWYHAFLSSGTFTPATALSCDVLVVAGGGGGGYTNNSYSGGGGGGAGGALAFASQALSTAQTVTVGAGGAGATGLSAVNGSNSQFASLTAAVGGGGGASTYPGTGAGNGGSGGGGDGDVYTTGGTGTSGQGNNGGFAGGGTQSPAGGGGAGAVGGSSSGYTSGSGGTGTTSITNWGALTTALTTLGLGVSNYLAGGGGGGARTSGVAGTATGGGANGGAAGAIGNNATANTGGGGGGAGSNYPTSSKNGGAGGSGVVIVRYLA